jgi:hypothetical protein
MEKNHHTGFPEGFPTVNFKNIAYRHPMDDPYNNPKEIFPCKIN